MINFQIEEVERRAIEATYNKLLNTIDINLLDDVYIYNKVKNEFFTVLQNIEVDADIVTADEDLFLADVTEEELANYFNDEKKTELRKLAVERYLYERKLSQYFIAEYIEYLDIEKLLIHNDLPEWFIEKNYDKIDINNILPHKKFSLEFLNNHKAEINWAIASCEQVLSEELIEEFANQVNWKGISLYQDLSDEFIANHQDQLNKHFINIRRANVSKA